MSGKVYKIAVVGDGPIDKEFVKEEKRYNGKLQILS